MTYSQYAYVEAFLDMKQKSWINAHVHMYEYFGGVARILVPDNCKTAVVHNGGFKDQQVNETYQEMAEYYGTAIIPARVRAPKDKPNAEGTVGNISTWITAALRNEQFFSLAELNLAIRDKLELFNQRLFQKKEGSRRSLFLGEEKPLLAPLPATRFELSDWKAATVQFNYHISVDGMLYSVSYEYIKKKVDVKVTNTTIKCQARMYKNTPSHSLKFIFVVSIVLFFYMLIIIPTFYFKFCFFIPFLHLKLKYYWYCNFNVIIISLSRQRFLYVRLCL